MRVRAQVDPQFQTVELYGPSDPETGAKSAMDSHTISGFAEGTAKAARAGGSGHVKRSAGTNMTALFGFCRDWRVGRFECGCQVAEMCIVQG